MIESQNVEQEGKTTKKNVKIKLTLEEKKALRIKRREEKKKRKELEKRQAHHGYISREIIYGDVTKKRCEKRWRKLLISITLPRLREELSYAWHTFERIIDSKDYIISLYMDEIREAEEQYMKNIRQHVEHIDRLLLYFRERIEEMNSVFKKSISNLIQEEKNIIGGVMEMQMENETYFKTIIFALHEQRKQYEGNIKGDLIAKLEDEKNIFKMNYLGMWDNLMEAFSGMLSYTGNFLIEFFYERKGRKITYKNLLAQDEAMKELIILQLKKINKMYEIIKKLKINYQNLEKKNNIRLSFLKGEKQYFHEYHASFKLALKEMMRYYKTNTCNLVCCTNTTLDYLEGLYKKGKKMLTLASMCAKFETQKEKLWPEPSECPLFHSKEQYIKVEENGSFENNDDEGINMFWKKVALADIKRIYLVKEKELLENENRLLRKEIFKYCSCVNCPVLPAIEESKRSSKASVICANDIARIYKKCGSIGLL